MDPEFQAMLGQQPAAPAQPAANAPAQPAPVDGGEQGGMDPEFAAMMNVPSIKDQQGTPAPKALPGAPQQVLTEAALHTLSGLGSSAIGGIGGLLATPTYALGITKTRPDSVVRGVQNALTYEPRTAGAQDLDAALALPGRGLAYLGRGLGDLYQRYGTIDPRSGQQLKPGVEGPAYAGGLDSAVQLAPMLLGAKLPYATPNDVNIGLNVGNSTALSEGDVLAALRARGVKVKSSVVRQSNSEPTVVARTNRPLSPDEARGVSTDLGQGSIAQYGPEGKALFGPKASEWGPFNPGYFLDETGEPVGPPNPTQDPLLTRAAELGLRLAPSEVNPGFNFGTVAESLSGAAKLARRNAQKNAPEVDAAVNRQVGVPEGTTPSPAALMAAKKAPNAVYAQAAQTGTVGLPTEITEGGSVSALDPGVARVIHEARSQLRLPPSDLTSMDAGELIDVSRQLRANGFSNIYAARYNPALKSLGQTQLEASKQLESALDSHVQQVASLPGSKVPADLVPQLQAARVTLAQIETARRALRGDHYFAGYFGKQVEGGAPLTGDMRTIGELYNRYDRSLQNVNKIRDGGPFSVLDLLGGTGGVEMAHLAGVPWWLTPAAIAARPLTRAFLGSRFYQSRAIARPPSGYVPPTISPVLQALKRASRGSPLVFQQPFQQPSSAQN